MSHLGQDEPVARFAMNAAHPPRPKLVAVHRRVFAGFTTLSCGRGFQDST